MFKKYWPLIIYLTAYFCLITYKLVSHPTPFFDWDESINVQVAKEMIEKKSLVPLWQGNIWLDKPPLPFLIFGVVMKLTPFIQPEISLRIFSLLLSVLALFLVYKLVNKGTSNKLISLLTVVITSFTPVFLQRSQILNLDVFLLIGWLGYALFVQDFWLSFLFLTISVLTKSLIGFYPAVILLIYFLFFRKNLKLVKQIIRNVLILAIWYLLMLLLFGSNFWQQHIVETHFRRVTASIESHFGQRTYYFDLIGEQLGLFIGLSIIGFSVIAWKLFRKQLTTDKLMYLFFLMPWFVFLNLTKTKIFWYLYPAIPQFALLSTYPLTLIKNRKILLYFISGVLMFYLVHTNFIKTNFFTTFYSKPEDYYRLSLYAKDKCESLTVIVGKESRDANRTLEDLGLTITSTTQWGDHPSLVYYFGKKVNFIYRTDRLSSISNTNNCLIIRKDDLSLLTPDLNLKQLKNYNSYYLFKR